MTDTEMPEIVTPEIETRDRPLPRARRRPPAPAQSASSLVAPVAGLLAFAGLVAIGFLVASRRRTPATPLLSHLPVPHLPSMPHMPAMPHMPSFDLHWVGKLAVVSAAQAAISHLVQSALRAWK